MFATAHCFGTRILTTSCSTYAKFSLVGANSHTPSILFCVLPRPPARHRARSTGGRPGYSGCSYCGSRLRNFRVVYPPLFRRLLPRSEPGTVWGFRRSVRDVGLFFMRHAFFNDAPPPPPRWRRRCRLRSSGLFLHIYLYPTGDRWCSKVAIQEGDKNSKTFICVSYVETT